MQDNLNPANTNVLSPNINHRNAYVSNPSSSGRFTSFNVK